MNKNKYKIINIIFFTVNNNKDVQIQNEIKLKAVENKENEDDKYPR